MLNWFRSLAAWFGRFRRRGPTYVLARVDGDELPAGLEPRGVYLASEEGVDWVAGLICPCGCGRRMELMVLPDVEPRWDVRPGKRGGATVRPSIWAASGCRSHFWIIDGELRWS